MSDDAIHCETCDARLMPGARCSHDRYNAIWLCENCTPSWRDLLADPSDFYERITSDSGPVYLTQAQAKALADAHLAAGGTLDDKMNIEMMEEAT